MAWIRQSPGIYKNDKTGEVRRSATKPTDDGAAAGSQPVSTGLPNTQLNAAKANLQDQVSKGWISQAQADAEYARLQSTGYGLAAPTPVKLETPQDVINVGTQLGKGNTQTSNQMNNPNQVNPFGSQTVTYDPVTGQPTVNQGLSKPNQQVLGGIQGNAVQANDVLKALMSGGAFGSLTNPAGGAPVESGFENAVFKQLTRDIEPNRAKDREQLSQTLANRGIPVGSELYNDQMKQLETRYDDQIANARNQAVTQSTNTALSAMPTFGSTGQSGFMTPQFQGFQGSGYQGVNVQDLFNQLQSYSLAQQQLAQQKELANKGSGGGGGGSSQPASPFNNTPPPGA